MIIIKKTVCIFMSLILSLSLFACNGEKKEHGRDIGAVTKVTDEGAPFKEGYYKGDAGGYMLRLVYTGNEAENSYDVYVYEAVDGTELFVGIAFGVDGDAEEFAVPGYNNEETCIKLEMLKGCEKDTLKLVNGNDHPYCKVFEGNYEFYGKSWLSDTKAKEHEISPGIYRAEFHRLTVEEIDGLTYFKITNSNAITLFSGKKKMADDKSTAAFSLPDTGSALRFYKGADNEGEFIEVIEIGNNIVGVEYTGRYYELED